MFILPAKIYRKVLKLGDSRVTALPPNWLRYFEIETGDTVEILYNSVVVIKPVGLKMNHDLLRKEFDPTFEHEDHEKRGDKKDE